MIINCILAFAALFLPLFFTRRRNVMVASDDIFMSIEYTNVLRCLAILMIMQQHLSGFILGSRAFTPFGGGGVVVFLVVSGFGLTASFRRKGLEHFWTKKAVRVFLPWLIVCLVAYLKDVVSGDVSTFAPSWWYLKYLLICYIVFYVCFKWVYRYRWHLLVSFAVLTFILGDGLQAEQCCSFQIGILLAERHNVKEWVKRNAKIIFVISSVLFIISLCIKQLAFVRMLLDNFYLVSHFLNFVLKISLGIAVMTFCLIVYRCINGHYAKFVGKISYELYLVHVAVVIGLCKDISCNPFAIIIVFIVMSFLLSWMLFLIDDKVLKFYSAKFLNQR